MNQNKEAEDSSIKELYDYYRENNKKITSYLILFSIGLILFSCYCIYEEYDSAKDYCLSVDGDYELRSFDYYCNGEKLYRHVDGPTKETYWSFDEEPTLGLP